MPVFCSPATEQLIERYQPPPEVATEVRRLGVRRGFVFLWEWHKKQGTAVPQDRKTQDAIVQLRATPKATPETQDPRPQHLKVYPELAAAAFRAKPRRTSPLRLWTLARMIDTQGKGWVPRSELWREWRQLKQTRTPRHFRNILADGDGVFWVRGDRDRLYLRGLKAVCQVLGVHRLACNPVLVPVSILDGGLRKWHAYLYAAFLKGRTHASNPISRATLSAVTGAGLRSQYNYENVLGRTLGKRVNYSLDGRLDLNDDLVFSWKEKGQETHARQLPNTYRISRNLSRAKRGRLRAVNHQMTLDLVGISQGRGFYSAPGLAGAPGQGNGCQDGGTQLYWQDASALDWAGQRGLVGAAFLADGPTKYFRANKWLPRVY